ncbi:MAG TPA: hypothetical protein VIJ76_01980 [Galbitalea sp.]
MRDAGATSATTPPDLRKKPAPPLTPEQRRRRRIRRGWIPSGVFAVLILVVVAITVGLHLQGLGNVSRALPGFSHFTGAGMQNVSNTGVIRLDLRSLPLAAKSIGLPASGTHPIAPVYVSDIDVTLTGGAQSARLTVGSVTVDTGNGVVREIRTSTDAGGDFGALGAALESDAQLGITDDQIANFLSDARGLNRNGASDYSRTVGTGRALGVPSTVSVKCTQASGCTVVTITRLSAR